MYGKLHISLLKYLSFAKYLVNSGVNRYLANATSFPPEAVIEPAFYCLQLLCCLRPISRLSIYRLLNFRLN